MKKKEAVEFCNIYYHDTDRPMQRIIMRAYLIGECARNWFQGEERRKYISCLRDFKHQKFVRIAKYINI